MNPLDEGARGLSDRISSVRYEYYVKTRPVILQREGYNTQISYEAYLIITKQVEFITVSLDENQNGKSYWGTTKVAYTFQSMEEYDSPEEAEEDLIPAAEEWIETAHKHVAQGNRRTMIINVGG